MRATPGVTIGRVVLLLIAAAATSGASCPRLPPAPVIETITAGVDKALDQIPPGSRPPAIFALRVDPPRVTFGIVAAGSQTQRVVEIGNVTDDPVTITGLTVSGQYFRMDPVPVPLTIAARGRIDVTFHFEPATSCNCRGRLTMATTASRDPQTVELSGRGVAGRRGPT